MWFCEHLWQKHYAFSYFVTFAPFCSSTNRKNKNPAPFSGLNIFRFQPFLGLKPQAVFLHRFAVKISLRRISTSSESPRFTVRAASLSPVPALMGMFHEPVTSLFRFNWYESEKRPGHSRSNQDANVDIENGVPLGSA